MDRNPPITNQERDLLTSLKYPTCFLRGPRHDWRQRQHRTYFRFTDLIVTRITNQKIWKNSISPESLLATKPLTKEPEDSGYEIARVSPGDQTADQGAWGLWVRDWPQTEIKVTRRVHLEIRFNLRSVLLDFQSFTEKPVFECAFAHPMLLFYHIWLKTVWIASPKEHEKKRWETWRRRAEEIACVGQNNERN